MKSNAKTFCGLCLPNSLGYVRSERFPCPPFSPALPVDAKAKMSFNGVNSKPKCPPQCSFTAMKWLYNVRRVEWCFFFFCRTSKNNLFLSSSSLQSVYGTDVKDCRQFSHVFAILTSANSYETNVKMSTRSFGSLLQPRGS